MRFLNDGGTNQEGLYWRYEMAIRARESQLQSVTAGNGAIYAVRPEAYLRVDRISGARLVQTVPGKILKYGTIELEAPGDHPDVRRLKKIAEPHYFYGELRKLLFGVPRPPDPDEAPAEFVTSPLPRIVDDPYRRPR